MNSLHPVWVITRREVRDQFRDWRIVFPIVLLTSFFPWLLNFTAEQLSGFMHRYGAPLIGDRMVPFLLMMVGFFPITISLVIALESFVGEKERRSLEPLLGSPLEDWQLYLGKLLAALVAPLLAALLGTLVYLVGIYRSHRLVAFALILNTGYRFNHRAGCGYGQRGGGNFLANHIYSCGELVGVFYHRAHGLVDRGRKCCYVLGAL